MQLDPSRRQIALRRFFSTLQLEPVGSDVFAADPGPGGRRMFGGLLAAQALTAARHTLGDPDTASSFRVHSVHCHFLLPGRHPEPLRIEVTRVRDGRSFSVRRSAVLQAGKRICEVTSSFTQALPGIEHQDVAPLVPPPEQCGDREERRLEQLEGNWIEQTINAVEVRLTDPSLLEPRVGTRPYQANWFRFPTQDVPSLAEREAMLLFASDRGLLSTAVLPHGLEWSRPPGASLDHALWFHRPTDLTQWHLFVSESPAAHGGLALVQTAIYTAAGGRIASVAQEALLRSPRAK